MPTPKSDGGVFGQDVGYWATLLVVAVAGEAGLPQERYVQAV